MKTENKQYKLKRWYPSLSKEWIEGDILDKHLQELDFFNVSGKMGLVDGDEVRNNPDFWEEVKQPLFVTDDNIKIFDDTTEIISVSIKHHTVSKWGYRYLCKPLDCENFKHFGIEANADKYIEENKPKPLFITEDGVEVFSDIDNLFAINLTYFSKTQNTLRSSRWLIDNPSYKVFSIESNADEYIWRNKRVFSYEDMMKAKHSIILTYEDIEKAAKERSER